MQTLSLIPSFEKKEIHSADYVSNETFQHLKNELSEVKNLANSELCEKKYLPYLAYSLQVDLWDEILTENEKRALIKASNKLHHHKGTKFAIQEILKAIGLHSADFPANIIEYKDREKYKYSVKRDGTHLYNGTVSHNNDEQVFSLLNWAEYAIDFKMPMSEKQLLIAKKIIDKYAPVRCVLKNFIYIKKQRDGTIFYNGSYTH